MRAKEFILETSKKDVNPKSYRADAMSSLPDANIYPDLDNSSGYLAYRFGIAMAGMPEQKMDVAGPTGLKMVTIGYTQADKAIIDATLNMVGTPQVRLTTGGSRELEDTNTTSPVSNWNKKK